MARKPAKKTRLEETSDKLESEKRWLALRGLWLQLSRDEPDPDQAVSYRQHAETAKARFEADCRDNSKLIHTPTPKRSPFHDYSISSWVRRHLKGVQPTAKRAVEAASMYDKEVTVIGNTLDGAQHTVLTVNAHGEVTFMHPQFKVKLTTSGGVA